MDSISANGGVDRAAKRERRRPQPSERVPSGDNEPPHVPPLEQLGEELEEIRRAVESGSSDDVSRAMALNYLKLLGRLEGLLVQLDIQFGGQVFEGNTLREMDIRASTYLEYMTEIYDLIFETSSHLLEHCGAACPGSARRPTRTARGAKPRIEGPQVPDANRIQSDPTMVAVTLALAERIERFSARERQRPDENGPAPAGPQAATGTGT